MWKLLKYEFRRARTSLLTVLGVIAVLEMYFLISLGVDHMEHVVIAAVLMMFASYGAAVYIFVRGVASYASELKAKSAYLIFMTPNSTCTRLSTASCWAACAARWARWTCRSL